MTNQSLGNILKIRAVRGKTEIRYGDTFTGAAVRTGGTKRGFVFGNLGDKLILSTMSDDGKKWTIDSYDLLSGWYVDVLNDHPRATVAFVAQTANK